MSGLSLRQRALEKYFSRMNDRQREAVFAVNGAVLVLAGAGRGKTTVLVNRIANMVLFGDAYEYDGELSDGDRAFLEAYDGNRDIETVSRLRDIISVNAVNPWSILAITFTNKAAGELKERLSLMLGDTGVQVNASTFHSACVKILRREISNIGYTSAFTIYDADDSKKLLKSCIEAVGLNTKSFAVSMVAGKISSAKDRLMDCDEYAEEAGNDYLDSSVAKVYKEYQSRLRAANALDFDDIIMLTVRLFEDNPDVLDHYRNLYRYIMVDEYQDTNYAQYVLVSMLAAKYGNLCVVGDDDQSIYKFRGATIENILSFEDEFRDCKVIRLEQNYRSTRNILNAANSVIRNNRGRKAKTLWTERGEGDRIVIYKSDSEKSEADFVAKTIEELVRDGRSYGDFAVLYRMNAQSNMVERAFTSNVIPYRVIGGLRFYDRKEIKDIIAYLSVINNPRDTVRFRRIINEPKRNIGESTLSKIEEIAANLDMTPLEVLEQSEDLAPLHSKAKTLKKAAEMFSELRAAAEREDPATLIDIVTDKTGYLEMLSAEGEEGIPRLENINELKSNIISYMERVTDEGEEPSLSGFLEEAALYTDADKADDGEPAVNMMTVHSAKGLEFPVVFLVGAEEGIFPSDRSKMDPTQLEEERRLAYVAITRAKDRLYITHSVQRLLFGMTQYNAKSRFIKEIDPECCEEQYDTSRAAFTGTAQTTHRNYLQKRLDRASSPVEVEFSVGDRVIHPKFGAGTVLSAKPMAGDSLVEIAFDTIGTRKLMARYARMTKE